MLRQIRLSALCGAFGLAMIVSHGCFFRPGQSSGKKGTGLVVTPGEQRLTGLVTPTFGAGASLPAAVDLAQWLPPARDQGAQNACVGFALGYALKTYQEARERGWDVDEEAYQYSSSYIFDRINQGCSIGASIKDGLDLLVNEGCLSLDVAPYDPQDCTQQAGTTTAPLISSRIRNYKLIAADDLDTVRMFLAADVPVILGFKAHDEWFDLSGANAMYRSTSGEPRNHVVLAVGYNDDLRAIKVFNSYGPGWGDNGFAWVDYEIWTDIATIAYVTEDEEQEPVLSFRSPTAYTVGDSPASIAIGDVDDDGDLDLAVANTGTQNVSVLLNDGDGVFADSVGYGVAGIFPESVLMGDLDGDDDLELVVSNAGTDSISVLLNNSDGTFAEAISYEVGNAPIAIALGDLDGDEDLDLVAANTISDDPAVSVGSVSVLLNNGDASFAAAINYEAGSIPSSLSLGDLDGDGDLDLAVVNTGQGDGAGGGDVSVFLNDGDGAFSLSANYSVGSLPRFVAMVDLDGDGDLELVVANLGSNDISVLFNDGTATFGAAIDFEVGGRVPIAIAIGDLDGDGDPDLTVSNKGSDDVSVLLNNGEGMFLAPLRFGAGFRPSSIVVGDLNGDGNLDVSVSNGQSNDVSVLLNQQLPEAVGIRSKRH